jgi:hypothetical protein
LFLQVAFLRLNLLFFPLDKLDIWATKQRRFEGWRWLHMMFAPVFYSLLEPLRQIGKRRLTWRIAEQIVFFKPGLGFILNYDAHIGDLFLLGVKASIGVYDESNSVYAIGGHVEIRF